MLRVAKPLQNGKIGLIFNEKGLKNHEKRCSKYQFHYEFLVFARTAKNAEAEFAYREIIVCAYARDDLRRRKRSSERHLFPAGAASIPCANAFYPL